MYHITITNAADKSLSKIAKSNPREAKKIRIFIVEILAKVQNPLILKNAKKMQGKAENQYRWRIGKYRIIGNVYNERLNIEIIKISSRQGAYE